MKKFDASIPRRMFWSNEVENREFCPECHAKLENEYHSYVMFIESHKKTASFILGNDNGYFCPNCPVVVLDYEKFSEVASDKILVASPVSKFSVPGIVNLDAIPKDKFNLPLGGDDNPVPLVKFLDTPHKVAGHTQPVSTKRISQRNKTSIHQNALILDMEDQATWDKLLSDFKAGKVPRTDLNAVEALLKEAEAAFAEKNMSLADKTFRKVLMLIAHCESSVARKKEIVILCGHRLLIARKQIGTDLTLKFSEMTTEGVCHLYAFAISKESERQRLVSVIAAREAVHDGDMGSAPLTFDMPPDEALPDFSSGSNGEKNERMALEHLSSSKSIPRNAPCPCGSGKKYKKCCGNKCP